jgi:hypothetical protein
MERGNVVAQQPLRLRVGQHRDDERVLFVLAGPRARVALDVRPEPETDVLRVLLVPTQDRAEPVVEERAAGLRHRELRRLRAAVVLDHGRAERVPELPLRAEVVVDQRLRDAARLRDRAQRGAPVTARGEERQRALQDLAARGLAVAAAVADHLIGLAKMKLNFNTKKEGS